MTYRYDEGWNVRFNMRNTDTNSYVYITDIGMFPPSELLSLAALENPIKVNELKPRENTLGSDVLYAVNAKKKNQSSNEAELPANAVPPIKGSSTISIADLLELVKGDFSDVLTDDVLNSANAKRSKSSLSESVVYKNNPENDNLSKKANHSKKSKLPFDENNNGISYSFVGEKS